ncbi:MAG: glycosyltransferase [Sphingomonadaceae bacterium]
MYILHISADYPDSIVPEKTQAIASLVRATSDMFDHQVISLNRENITPWQGLRCHAGQSWPAKCVARHEARDDWVYSAPSHGVFLHSSLECLAEILAENLLRRGHMPKLVIGHKLSMEGIIAHRLGQLLGIPFGISVQGHTDQRILSVRRDLQPLYRRIFHQAAVVFPFSPWALQFCENRLGRRSGPVCLLPCISDAETIIPPRQTGPRIMTAFHLRNWKVKNLPAMLLAIRQAEKSVPDLQFAIYGGGEAQDQSRVNSMVARSRAPAKWAGSVPHASIQQVMNGHSAFMMVSRRESFGLVFIEALRAGCPVIYPRGAAIDGYFDGEHIALGVDRNDPAAMAEAIVRTITDQQHMKQALLRWQEAGGARAFSRDHISRSFANGLIGALQGETGQGEIGQDGQGR